MPVIGSRVGAWLTGVTTKTKLLLVVLPSGSVTTTVMVAKPASLAAGVIARARLVPLPLRVILPFGTRRVLDDMAGRPGLLPGASECLPEKAIARMAVF